MSLINLPLTPPVCFKTFCKLELLMCSLHYLPYMKYRRLINCLMFSLSITLDENDKISFVYNNNSRTIILEKKTIEC